MATFFHVGCSPEVDFANRLLLNQAARAARKIPVLAATVVNKSYCSGTMNRVLNVKNSISNSKTKNTHFMDSVSIRSGLAGPAKRSRSSLAYLFAVFVCIADLVANVLVFSRPEQQVERIVSGPGMSILSPILNVR